MKHFPKLLLGLLLLSVGTVSGATRRPNVIFLIVDDSEAIEYGCYGGRTLTPNIDRLAEAGIRFQSGFTSSSVCTPTRYSCLTGQYASRAKSLRDRYHQPEGLPTFVRWNTYLEPGGHNVASVLKSAGYTTAMVGKWHVGHSPAYAEKVARIPGPKFVSENAAVAAGDPHGDRKMTGSNAYALDDPAVNAHLRAKYGIAVDDIRQNFGFDHVSRLYSGNLTDYPKQMRNFCYHNQDWVTEGALDFLDAQVESDKPFFLYLSSTLQHGPSPEGSIRADRRITPAGLLDRPVAVQPGADSIYQRLEDAGLPKSKAPFVWLDDSVGSLLDKLVELKMDRNTLIFFFSDQQSWGKGSCFDGGVRTPLLMCWPGKIKGGQVNDDLVSNIDFAPTILEACGVKAPEEMKIDGMSILPLANGSPDDWREALFFELGNMRAARTRDFKYIATRDYSDAQWEALPENLRKGQEFRRRYFQLGEEWRKFNGTSHVKNSAVAQWRSDHAAHASDPDQLYDLRVDPSECVNFFDNAEYRVEAAEMKQRLRDWLATMPGPYAEFK